MLQNTLFCVKINVTGRYRSYSLLKQLYFRVARNRQMLGNRITAKLCACRYADDDADGGLSTA